MLTKEDIRRESMRIIREDVHLSKVQKVLKQGYAMRILGPSAVGQVVADMVGRKVKPLPQFVRA